LLDRDDARDREGSELLRLVLDALDFEADHGEAIDDRLDRRCGVEMLLEPGQREFHDDGSEIPIACKAESMTTPLRTKPCISPRATCSDFLPRLRGRAGRGLTPESRQSTSARLRSWKSRHCC